MLYTADFYRRLVDASPQNCLNLTSTNGIYTVSGFPGKSILPIQGWLHFPDFKVAIAREARRGQGMNAAARRSSEGFRINAGPPIHPNGSLIKTQSDPTVYVIQNGQKRPLPSPDALYYLYDNNLYNGEFDFGDVITVANDEMGSYPTGPIVNGPLPDNGLSEPDGRLIRQIGGTEVSIVTNNGQRRPFISDTVFLGLGFQFSNVIEIDDYDSYTVGPPITGGPEGTPVNDFSLTISPPMQVKRPGDSASFSIGTSITYGSSQSLNLSVRGLPSGTTYSFGSPTITSGQSTGLTLFTSSSTPAGGYTLTVVANGTTSHSTAVTLTIATDPVAAFSMSIAGRSATNGQTLTVPVSPNNNASVDFDSSSSQSGGGTIDARQWQIDGINVSTLPRFTYSLGAGTHTVNLDVMNSANIHNSTSGAVVVTSNSAPAPSITSINPTSIGPSAFDLTIGGSNFDSGAIDQIYFGNTFVGNGTILSRTATQIVVHEAMSTATLGTYAVKVKNSDGQLSNGLPLTLTQTQTPAPTIVSISPSSVAPSIFDLTINGSNFDNGAIDQVFFGSNFVGNGTILSRSATQIRVRESMTTAALGNYTVKVKNSDGQLSNGVGLAITLAPTTGPVISSITPNPVPTFNANQNVQVNGSNFQTNLTVDVFNSGGTKIATLSGSQVLSVTPTSFTMVVNLGSTASTFGIEVVNPDGGRSARFSFTTIAPNPIVSSISPNPAPVFNGNQDEQVFGSNFQFNLTVDVFNSSGTKVGMLSGSQILNVTPTSFTMVVNLGSIASTFGIEVVNPNGGRSARFNFSTHADGPVVSSISPNPVPTFNADQNVQVTGSNFQANLTVDV
jgi:hypothetical protein